MNNKDGTTTGCSSCSSYKFFFYFFSIPDGEKFLQNKKKMVILKFTESYSTDKRFIA